MNKIINKCNSRQIKRQTKVNNQTHCYQTQDIPINYCQKWKQEMSLKKTNGVGLKKRRKYNTRLLSTCL